jgi:predicted membrane metal-binding protein
MMGRSYRNFGAGVRALWGLFIDDGLLAFGLIAWIALAALLVPRLGLTEIGGPILFAGAVLVLLGSLLRVRRRASRPAKSP